ncbi:hypothetical protein EVA_04311 [gut metagenome]|uniref:Uncharacterized protein n=1 Tax=gut metagenome TaxID=749906 RepID=J9GJX9_9ZZZZ
MTTSDGYKTLIIPPELQDGKTDFLSGDGNSHRIGSASKPFVVDANTDYEAKTKPNNWNSAT